MQSPIKSLLGFKMIVERSMREIGGLHEIADGNAGQPVLAKQPGGFAQDPFVLFGGLGRRIPRHSTFPTCSGSSRHPYYPRPRIARNGILYGYHVQNREAVHPDGTHALPRGASR